MHFDHNKTIGALGTLVAAKWYRSQHAKHLLISLDSADARRWMSMDTDARRADLLGLMLRDGKAVLDVMEVKSGDDARSVYRLRSDRTLEGRPVEQLLNTFRSVAGIFGLNELKDHVLTPPRREILRSHFYRQGFSGNRTSEEKKYWGESLNALFNGEIIPEIRLNLVVVNFGINQKPADELVRSADGVQVRLVHLNEHAVNLQLGQDEAVAGPPPRPKVVVADRAESAEESGEQPPDFADEPPLGKKSPARRADLAGMIEQMCGKLRAACEDYQIRVSEIDPEKVDVGPSVLRYKIKLAPGEQGEKLRKQAENIARQLAAESVPMVDFLRGTEYMYLDMARPDRQEVSLDPLLSETRIGNLNELPLYVGVDPSGKAYQLDLGDDRLPHLLVAGGTGSGKTIFLYSVVLSLISAHPSAMLELVIVDPKQTDFTVFGHLPHLRNHEVIIDAEQGVEALRHIAEQDMAERSRTLQEARQRDIKSYNLAHVKKPIRPLVVVIDEYADLVAVLAKKEREQFDLVISRLAARGRNVGIHLVVATQRPTADVITGNIKANMPCRLSFSLPSGRDSQVILDEPGAERLLRKGDMLMMFEGQLVRLQGYYTNPQQLDGLLRRMVRTRR